MVHFVSNLTFWHSAILEFRLFCWHCLLRHLFLVLLVKYSYFFVSSSADFEVMRSLVFLLVLYLFIYLFSSVVEVNMH